MPLFHKFSKVLCVALALVPLLPENTEAAVLLTTIRADTESRTAGGGVPGDLVITEATIGYGYDFVDFTGGSGPLGIDVGPAIGLGTFWQLGETGSVDFDDNNSPGFAGVVSRITNGVDDRRTQFGLVPPQTQESAPSFYGGAGSGFESFYTSPQPDLFGNSIDFIRLVVEKVFFDIEYRLVPNGVDAVVVDIEARFEFWGSPISVPVSGEIWFLMFGALASVRLAKRRAA